MSMVMQTLLVFALPWATGIALWSFLTARPRSGFEWAGAIGYGYFVGLLVTSVLAGIVMLILADASRFLVVLALFLILGFCLAKLWGRDASHSAPASPASSVLLRVLWWALLAWLSWRFFITLSEAVARPIYPWDAWSTWAVKAKIWFGLNDIVPFVPHEVWLNQNGSDLYTTQAWGYPPLIPLWQMWVALGVEQWHEPLINATWPLCGLALILAMYGQLRTIGLTPTVAMLACYVLGSLPILNTHMALAGYGDVLLASGHGLATLALLRFAVTNEYRQYWVAVGIAAGLMYIKLEGAVWLVTLLPALVMARLESKGRRWFVAVATLLALILLFLDRISFWVPTLGVVRIEPGLLHIPLIGDYVLGFRNTGKAILTVMFDAPNWHLLWFAVVAGVILRFRHLLDTRVRATGTTIVTCGLAFLFFLFFYTDASQWADNFTSTNRLVLHLVPAIVAWLALLVNESKPPWTSSSTQ
ncbi:MAG: hypothetical protein DHS20C11_18630 [Lysobacteraceae bacterium]|nr:MAG: hypothetical protein DHS20C11_18630 [Xanthomonadaceae bacterium]